ncbi:MAG TPA: hypothetical protein VEU30_13535, partial [Thermoanaerobaculia bacterium]|nr:hypothetical protein [Thermoanaerobaculia bacterium]
RNDIYAFLVFPFTYTQTFVAGYYNFSLSIGLFLIILAVWWRRRDVRSVATVAIEAALLVLCYFTHPQATLLACASVAFLSVMTRRFFHLFALIPVIPLLATFAASRQANAEEPLRYGISWVAARILARVETMYSLGDGQLPLATGVAVIFAVLILLTLIRERGRREANLLAVLALGFAAMRFCLPAPAGTRDLFTQRNSLFVFLTLIPWFTPQVRRNTLVVILTVVAVANAAINFDWFRRLGRELDGYVRMFDGIESGTTLLPLYFVPAPSPSIVDVYVHAISYVALEKRLVDHANYEPGTRYFPIALRDDAINPSEVEYAPGAVDLARLAQRATYVVTRGLAEGSAQRRTLDHLYRLIRESGDLRIYRRKDPLLDHELVLLPLLGTTKDVGAPNGAWWRIEQRITNRGGAPVKVIFHECLEAMPCELTVGESAPVASTEKFAFLHVPRGAALDITTVVRRVDVERPDLSIVLPAPREAEFRAGGARIEDLRPGKIGLRLYLITDRAWSPVTIRLRDRRGDHVIAQRTLDVAGYGMFENADLNTDFPGYATKTAALDVEIETPPDARVWAFATEANDAGQTRVVTF